MSCRKFILKRININLMSFIESIPEQDSLLENSEMHLFINSNQKQSIRIMFKRPSLVQFPTEIIPQKNIKAFPRKPWQTTQPTTARSKSSMTFRKQSTMPLSTSRISVINPQTARSRASSSLALKRQKIGAKHSQNQNIQSIMHKINIKSMINPQKQSKLPPTLGRRQSCFSLRPKVIVESQRLLNKKYQRSNPFAPDYLESEYLQ